MLIPKNGDTTLELPLKTLRSGSQSGAAPQARFFLSIWGYAKGFFGLERAAGMIFKSFLGISKEFFDHFGDVLGGSRRGSRKSVVLSKF